MTQVTDVQGIGPGLATMLIKKGIKTVEQLAAASPAELTAIPGIGVRRAETLTAAAVRILGASFTASSGAKGSRPRSKATEVVAEPSEVVTEVATPATSAKTAKSKKSGKKNDKKAAKKKAAKKKAEKAKAAKKTKKKTSKKESKTSKGKKKDGSKKKDKGKKK